MSDEGSLLATITSREDMSTIGREKADKIMAQITDSNVWWGTQVDNSDDLRILVNQLRKLGDLADGCGKAARNNV